MIGGQNLRRNGCPELRKICRARDGGFLAQWLLTHLMLMKISAPPRRISWLTLPLVAWASLVTSCGDSKPVAYRIPKEKETTGVAVTAPSAAPAAPANVPAGHPDIGGAAVPAAPLNGGTAGGGMGAAMANGPAMATAAGPGLTWTAPAHWTAKAVSSMRKGSFTVAGPEGATADLAITAFPGDVGGEVANVNRWRGQLGLAPLSPADATAAITHLQVNGLAVGVVDFANAASPAQRIHGAMVPYQGATWFFKLVGPDAVVAPEHDAFLAFLKSIKPAADNAAPAATP